MPSSDASDATALLEQLARNLNDNEPLRLDLCGSVKGTCNNFDAPLPPLSHSHSRYALRPFATGTIVFDIEGSGRWLLDLREGKGTLQEANADADADLVLTMAGDTFVKLVAKKISSQQAFLMRKLKIKGSMGMAMKLQPVLDAAVDGTPSKL